MYKQKTTCRNNECSLTDKRTLNPKKPKSAGNNSFRKHNKLRFLKTLESKQIGLKNKL